MSRTLTVVAAAAMTISLAPHGALAATTQADDRAMTRLAAQVISDASAARTALASHKTSSDAENDIGHAIDARNQLAAQARAAGMPMIVPIYAELDDTAVLSDAVKQKPAARATPPTVVRANAADLTYLAIDLDKAKAHLDAAKAALAHDNDQAARDSLAAVGSDLVEESVVTDVPLLTAREDLSRAQREIDAGNRAAAMTDLHQASQSLRNYTTGDHVGDARILASTIDTDTTGNGNASPSIGSKIENWWSSVAQWARQKV